jgi:uncharacterized protein (TIGR00730 family)
LIEGLPLNPEDANFQAILSSPSLVLAERDLELLARPELRPVRLQLELLKPEMALAEQRIRSTVVVFGSTEIVEKKVAELRLHAAQAASKRSPDDAGLLREVKRCERLLTKSHFYDEAREFGRLISSRTQTDAERHFVIVTGGGPGIMEAVNRGAFDVGAKSVGLNILLPSEQQPNPFITPELCFQFHYFALRKLHFLLRAKALVAFPGGFGTMDEVFDALTLRQTRRMQAIPIIMYSQAYWERVLDLHFLADEGVIGDEDLALVQYAETPQQIVDIISSFYDDPSLHGSPR